jgi:ABC-type hemin transport system substrate-binding protein
MADDLLQWLGAENLAHEVHGLKHVPPRILPELASDLVILVRPSGGTLPKVPGLSETPAGKLGRIVIGWKMKKPAVKPPTTRSMSPPGSALE